MPRPTLGEDHRHVGERRGEGGTVPHLRGEEQQLENQAVPGQQPELAAQRRVVHHRRPVGEAVLRILVPVQLHTSAAQERIPALRP